MPKKSAVEVKQEQLEASLSELQNKHGNLEGWVQNQLLEVKRQLDNSMRAEGQRLEALLKAATDPVAEKTMANESKLREVQRNLGELESSLKGSVDRVAAAETRLMEAENRESVVAEQAEARHRDVSAGFQEVRGMLADLQSSAVNIATMQERLSEQEERSRVALERFQVEFRGELVPISEQCDSVKVAQQGMSETVREATESFAKAREDLRSEFGEASSQLKEELERQVNDSLSGISESQEKQFAELKEVLTAQQDEAQQIAAAARGAYNRSATWCIHGFKDKLHQLLQSESRSIRSPGLLLCSLPEIELELHVSQGDKLTPMSPAQMPGMASLRMWATQGLRLSFKLTLGEGSSAVVHNFEHTFLAGEGGERTDSGERAVFQMWNICQPGLIWNRHADTFHMSLEVREFHLDVRTIESVPETTMVSLGNALGDRLPEDIARYPGDADDIVAERGTDVVDVAYSRVWSCEAQLQESVNREIRGMKSRSVRRVEWRLEGCSRLLDVCRPGESVDSPVFQAVGLERIQFHFYPRGSERVEGGLQLGVQPCAFYLSGPHKTTLRGTLSVGSISRPFEHRFDQRGDVGGRNRICTLQNQLDCDDAVTLVLDVTDVEVDLPDMIGSLCLREARSSPTSPMLLSRRSHGELSVPLPVGPGSKGSIHIRRVDPSKTEEFVKCVSLPTLSTRNMLLPSLKAGRRP